VRWRRAGTSRRSIVPVDQFPGNDPHRSRRGLRSRADARQRAIERPASRPGRRRRSFARERRPESRARQEPPVVPRRPVARALPKKFQSVRVEVLPEAAPIPAESHSPRSGVHKHARGISSRKREQPPSPRCRPREPFRGRSASTSPRTIDAAGRRARDASAPPARRKWSDGVHRQGIREGGGVERVDRVGGNDDAESTNVSRPPSARAVSSTAASIAVVSRRSAKTVHALRPRAPDLVGDGVRGVAGRMRVDADVEAALREMQREPTSETFGGTGDENASCHGWSRPRGREKSPPPASLPQAAPRDHRDSVVRDGTVARRSVSSANAVLTGSLRLPPPESPSDRPRVACRK
jgi:hypothetical protein